MADVLTLVLIYGPLLIASLIEWQAGSIFCGLTWAPPTGSSSPIPDPKPCRRRLEEVVYGHRLVLSAVIVLLALVCPTGILYEQLKKPTSEPEARLFWTICIFFIPTLIVMYFFMINQAARITTDNSHVQRRRRFHRSIRNVFQVTWLNIMGLVLSVGALSIALRSLLALQRASQ